METDDSYADIGTLLSEARKRRRLSREQVSRLIHIRVKYVEALEEGRFDHLPGIIYTKGYLNAYASFLELDRDEVLRRFEQVENILGRKGFYLPTALIREKTPSLWFVWGGVGGALLIYLFWLFALQPKQLAISVVEPFPTRAQEKVHISASALKEVTCLQPQDILYPPCYRTKKPGFTLVPLQGQLNSVMELAEPDSE